MSRRNDGARDHLTAAQAAVGVIVLLLVSGCGGGGSGSMRAGASPAHSITATGKSDAGTTGSSEGSTPVGTGPSSAVVIQGCPDPGAMGDTVGFPVKKTSLGESGCAYFPRGEESPGISVQVLHPQKAFPDLTTLAEMKKHDRFGGGTAETESADSGGGHITSFLEDTPEYGPETFRAGESIEGKTDAESFVSCDYFVLGTDGYPASVQAIAQKGGAYSYAGEEKSRNEVCEWATAALELAIEK